jgi:hypothetical protein
VAEGLSAVEVGKEIGEHRKHDAVVRYSFDDGG